MQKVKKIKFAFEFILILGMFLLTFISFNYIFKVVELDSYYKEVIAALIAMILTIIITALLLKQQAKSGELKEQNVEVFKRKVEVFDDFIKLLCKIYEDDLIDEQEARKLKDSIYSISLFCSEKTIEKISKFIRNKIIGDTSEDISLLDVVSQFRSELKLQGVDSFSASDLEAIDNLLTAGYDKINVYKEIHAFVKNLRTKLISTFKNDLNKFDEEAFAQYQFSEVSGSSSWVGFEILNENETAGILQWDIGISYPKEKEINQIFVEVIIWNLFELTGQIKSQRLFKNQINAINEITKELGFKYIDKNKINDPDFVPHYYKEYTIKTSTENGVFKIIDRAIHKKLVDDILNTELNYLYDFEEVDEEKEN